MTGSLCVESAYPVAMQFVKRDPNHPVSIREEEVSVCVQLLMNGTVEAVFTDRPVLSWFVSNYQLAATHVSPILGPNPFSFVYPSGSQLRQYVNPAIIAAQTNQDWIPLANALQSRYFSTGASASSGTITEVHMPSFVAAFALVGITIIVSLINGDCGPGVRQLRKFGVGAPEAEEDPGGTDARLEAVMAELFVVKEMLRRLDERSAGSERAHARSASRKQLPDWGLSAPPSADSTLARPSVPLSAPPQLAEEELYAQRTTEAGCIPGLNAPRRAPQPAAIQLTPWPEYALPPAKS